jgi:hypothetical protein
MRRRREVSTHQRESFPARLDSKAVGDKENGAAITGGGKLGYKRAELPQVSYRNGPFQFRDHLQLLRQAGQSSRALGLGYGIGNGEAAGSDVTLRIISGETPRETTTYWESAERSCRKSFTSASRAAARLLNEVWSVSMRTM